MLRVVPDAMSRRVSQMRSRRMQWEPHWRQIERRINPRGDQFSGHTPGSRRTEYIYDSTATLALGKFAAGMVDLNCPSKQVWHELQPTDRRLRKSMAVRRYLDEVNDALWDYRYAASAGFATQIHEAMIGLGSLGTAPMWIEGNNGRGIVYRALHISEAAIDVNAAGIVDTVARQIKLTGRQAMQKFDPASLPQMVRDCAEKEPGREFTFTHLIAPRTEYDPTRMDARNMPWGSWYWLEHDGKALITRESGFVSFPLPVARYTTAPGEIYGRSVAMMALPDIKMINEMAKSMLRATHLALDPPLLLPDDGVMTRMQTKPGALNYGGVNARGERLVQPLQTGANLAAGYEMMDQVRATINDAFLVRLFQALMEEGRDRMTATEVLERVREKGVLLAPAAQRIETELLGPMLEREMDILGRTGLLPPMPEELAAAGGEVTIVYNNPMSRAAKAERASGFFRTVEALAPLAQVEPEVLDGFDFIKAAKGVAEITGVPAEWLRSDEEIAARKDAREQAAQAQQLLQALPVGAKAALDAARAEDISGGLESVA